MAEVDIDKVCSYKGLKLMSWNIRSLVPKMAEFELTIERLSPDIICITESWRNETIPNSRLEINGYALFRHDRLGNKKGGGLCIYGKKNLGLDPNTFNHLNVCNTSAEIQVVKLQLPCTKPIIILNSYRPPNGSLPQAIVELQSVLVQSTL